MYLRRDAFCHCRLSSTAFIRGSGARTNSRHHYLRPYHTPTSLVALSNRSETAVDAMGTSGELQEALDFVWLFICSVLVVLMQPGFAALEIGTIRASDAQTILLKNLGDATVGFLAWFLLGHALAQGENGSGVAGKTFFAFSGDAFESDEGQPAAASYIECLFGWAFASTCTTIVSGAVADRVIMGVYYVYAFLTSGIFYPLVAYAVWADQGWASAKRDEPWLGCGVIDYAGSGVVHMLGGGIGLFIAAFLVKGRKDRFVRGDQEIESLGVRNVTKVGQLNELGFRSYDPAWTTLGTFLLWIGWFGFNCGSGLGVATEEQQRTAGRAAVNTTIGGSIGGVASMLCEVIYHVWSPTYRRGRNIVDPFEIITTEAEAAYGPEACTSEASELGGSQGRARSASSARYGHYQEEHEKSANAIWLSRAFRWPLSTHKTVHGAACNGILAGLVSITAGCATMDHFSAFFVSAVAALVYHVSYRVFLCCKIDDAVNAGAVHFVCGFWGLLAAGFTATAEARSDAGYPDEELCGHIAQTRANAAMGAIITLWVVVCSAALWVVILIGQASETSKEGTHVARVDPDLTRFRTLTDRLLEEHGRRLHRHSNLHEQSNVRVKDNSDRLDEALRQITDLQSEVRRQALELEARAREARDEQQVMALTPGSVTTGLEGDGGRQQSHSNLRRVQPESTVTSQPPDPGGKCAIS